MATRRPLVRSVTAMLAIRCVGLTKRYHGRPVVDGLDLEVEQGELFGFLGPNGAGKTTTARMLLGLVAPDDGQAWVLGSRVPCPQQLPRIGAMVEEPAFYPWLTGRANLQILGREGGRLPSRAIDDALDAAGIASAAAQKVKTYSQGMRQRLGLAAALVRRPDLVLLDEPANGLDPAGIRDLRDLLRSMADQGTTVFLSSHLLGEVEQVCRRVAVIDHGRLVSMGAVDDVGGAGERVRVSVRPDEIERARAALARWSVTVGAPGELMVADAVGGAVNEVLAEADVFARSVILERLTLEERFLAVTDPDGASDSKGDRDAAAAS